MTKFAFRRRAVVETDEWFEADTEQEAWAMALADQLPLTASSPRILNRPVFRRQSKLDEHDL